MSKCVRLIPIVLVILVAANFAFGVPGIEIPQGIVDLILWLLVYPVWTFPLASIPDLVAGAAGPAAGDTPAIVRFLIRSSDLLFFLLRGALAAYVGYSATFALRSFIGWLVLSFLLGPVVGGIMLFVAGVSHAAVAAELADERISRRHPGQSEKSLRFVASRDSVCPHCQAMINVQTDEGVEHVESKPWILRCAACHRELDVSP